jgi:hypothetical protein
MKEVRTLVSNFSHSNQSNSGGGGDRSALQVKDTTSNLSSSLNPSNSSNLSDPNLSSSNL